MAWRNGRTAWFKTTARPPAPGQSPAASHVTQVALYRRLLQDIYPGRAVRAFLVFTSGPVIHEVPEPDLESALASIRSARDPLPVLDSGHS